MGRELGGEYRELDGPEAGRESQAVPLGSGAAEMGERGWGEEGLSEWFLPRPTRNFIFANALCKSQCCNGPLCPEELPLL